MRFPFRLLSICVLHTQAAVAQKPAAAPTTTAEYDRIRDRTVVTFERFAFGADIPMGYGISSKELALLVTYETSGHTEVIPDSVTLRFVQMSIRPYWQLMKDHDLDLLLGDNTRLHVVAAAYDTATIASNTIENIRFRIPRTLLQSIASASSVEGAIADKRFVLLPDQRRALLAFVTSHSSP